MRNNADKTELIENNMNLNDNQSSTSNKNHTTHAPHPNAGVADYFAVLGIGEKLTLKHSQGNSTQIEDETPPTISKSSSSPTTTNENSLKDHNDEEAQMMERFYREIVEIQIISNIHSHGSPSKRAIHPIPSSPQTPFHQLLRSATFSKDEQEENDENDEFDDDPVLATRSNTFESPSPTKDSFSSIYNPPNIHSNNNTLPYTTADGFTVLTHTAPAGIPSSSSLFSNQHYHSSKDRNNPKSNPWNTGQRFSANINPYIGVRTDIQTTLHSSSSSFSPSKSDSRNDSFPLPTSPSSRSPSRFQKLFANKHPLYSPNTNTHTTNNKSSLLDTSSYHIGYRRRGADEGNTPAIANVELIYLRIPNQYKYDNHIDPSHSSDQDTTDKEETKSSQPVATLTRGLVTGAGMAARAGRSLFQRNSNSLVDSSPNNDMNSTHQSLLDQEDTKNEDSISNPYPLHRAATLQTQNKSTTDKAFPPTIDTSSSSSPSTPNPVKVYLPDLLPIPEGYHDLVLPQEYQYISIPPPSTPISSLSSQSIPQKDSISNNTKEQEQDPEYRRSQRRLRKTLLFPTNSSRTLMNDGIIDNTTSTNTPNSKGFIQKGEDDDTKEQGVEAYVDGSSFLRSPSSSPDKSNRYSNTTTTTSTRTTTTTTTTTTNKGIETSLQSMNISDNPSSFRNHCLSLIEFPLSIQDVTLHTTNTSSKSSLSPTKFFKETLLQNHPPKFTSSEDIPIEESLIDIAENDVVPVIAIRYQHIGEEERFYEDAAMTDLSLTFMDELGRIVMPSFFSMDESIEEEEEEDTISLLSKTSWAYASTSTYMTTPIQILGNHPKIPDHLIGSPVLISKRNLPMGFADAPFAASVLDRFPKKNYKGLPLPEEELPMFCYPTGCRLQRALLRDAPLPKCYGFVVKNERGDSLYVSCISFMEPLSTSKCDQIDQMSIRRRKTSLAHQRYFERKQRASSSTKNETDFQNENDSEEKKDNTSTPVNAGSKLIGFDDMMTFENKTLCLVSRYPHWTAFRRFLSHLHILSNSVSEMPLERHISHLLLAVPVPKPGGASVIIPLKAMSEPMILEMPPKKDLPLVGLPYHRLFGCLNVKMVVTLVLGFLALERKVILMSAYPSLVLDACELLRALLFPFELCAPYVPRLTQPFMSCLEFPGAIFVGIHDDGSPDGLATNVRENVPEDTIIVDLDTGEVQGDSNCQEVLKQCWGIIPTYQREALVSEIEALCKDAGLVPGKEPIGSQVDGAESLRSQNRFIHVFGSETQHLNCEPLDGRAIRDAFLRFFCSVLEGYERYLVVPDMDFLISGNEWFDSKRFLASALQDKAPFLGSLVTTQLFQSFIQRRTEASDLHCMLFDDCQTEFLSSHEPYGRLGETNFGSKFLPDVVDRLFSYDLLVDQCATEGHNIVSLESENMNGSIMEDSFLSDAETTFSVSGLRVQSSFISLNTTLNNSFQGLHNHKEIVTHPTRDKLALNSQFGYFRDGHSSFPQSFHENLFLPLEPEKLQTDMSEIPVAILTRSDRELEEANRRRKIAVSDGSGLNKQRRCLWQLPKLLASHFLGSWLLCIPSQLLQSHISNEQHAKILLRAFGALRLLKSRHRIIPDEASYRALMVACGRSKSDRRIELVKIFGLLRSDGIFPSAVTLGQYTRAIAEGFSKRSSISQDEINDNSTALPDSDFQHRINEDNILNALDEHLEILEEAGRKWRQRSSNRDGKSNRENPIDMTMEVQNDISSKDRPSDGNDLSFSTQNQTESGNKRSKENRKSNQSWGPILYATSFAHVTKDHTISKPFHKANFKFIALWSRATECISCGYIPFDEEIQAGWDETPTDNEIQSSISCPRCKATITPRLGYLEMLCEKVEAKALFTNSDESEGLPPQLRNTLSNENTSRPLFDEERSAEFVTYLSPSILRLLLEKHVEENGEEVLERETLRKLDDTVYFNLWWYCLRFSLPFPLPVSSREGAKHHLAFGSWDRSLAIQGCKAGSKYITSLLHVVNGKEETKKNPSSLSQFFDNEKMLSHFNLQTYTQGDWDQVDLSKILVTLVEACDKRDFLPVLQCIVHCNRRKLEKLNGQELLLLDAKNNRKHKTEDYYSFTSSNETLDCYRTILYLAKYQCTTAFHIFFPATSKGCKGYHFWCSIGTPQPIFDRLFRNALIRLNGEEDSSLFESIAYVSDIALGFRCIFGHVL